MLCCCQAGLTPLHEAAKKGHVEVVKILLKAGATIDAKNKVLRLASPCVSQLLTTPGLAERPDSTAFCVCSRSHGGRKAAVGQRRGFHGYMGGAQQMSMLVDSPVLNTRPGPSTFVCDGMQAHNMTALQIAQYRGQTEVVALLEEAEFAGR